MRADPITLAIDSTSRTAGCALVRGPAVLGEAVTFDQGTAETLTQLIGDVCAEQPLSGIAQIVVAVGPGSFTGIRTGLSTAQGLAAGLNVPVLGVSLLLARLAPVARPGAAIAALLPASRDEHFLSAFAFERHGVRQLSVTLLSPAEAVGNAYAQDRIAAIEEQCSRPLTRVDLSEQRLPENTAIVLARAAETFVAGADLQEQWRWTDRGLGLSPLYIKGAHAKTIAERRAAAAEGSLH